MQTGGLLFFVAAWARSMMRRNLKDRIEAKRHKAFVVKHPLRRITAGNSQSRYTENQPLA